MKKTTLIISLLGICSLCSFAQKDSTHQKLIRVHTDTTKLTVEQQEPDLDRSFFKVGLWPGLSTSGKRDNYKTNNVTFNLIGGKSYNEYGFMLNGIFGSVINRARGVQISGLAQQIHNKGEGLSIATLYNAALRYDGVMIHLGFGRADEMRGMQIGGFNGSNIMQGMQLGIVNQGRTVKGVQFGLFNTADDLSGIQIGAINERDKGGMQLGIVNFSKTNKYPIGIVNIVRDGRMSVSIEADELASTSINFRSGGEVLYGIVGAGYNFKSDDNHFLVQGGIGAHVPLSRKFSIDAELVATWLLHPHIADKNKDKVIQMNSPMTTRLGTSQEELREHGSKDYSFMAIFRPNLRILPHFHFNEKWSIFAGPTLNYMQTNSGDKNMNLFPNHNIWKRYRGNKLKQLYVGYMGGVKFHIK